MNKDGTFNTIQNAPRYHLHFIGIGGAGMSGIAAVFAKRGHTVTGTDLQYTDTIKNLEEMGIKCAIGHSASNIQLPLHAVVVSTAVKADNVEVIESRRLGIPIIQRAEMLAELMRGKKAITLAGTHGKTTTTTMVGRIFQEAGYDPTVVVGGKVEAFAGNSTTGLSEWVIAEADESDGSFQFLPFIHTVVTNIDDDHLDFYGTRADVEDAFVAYLKKTPFFGSAWLCGDDQGVRRILPKLSKPYRTYGFSESNVLRAMDVSVQPNRTGMLFRLIENLPTGSVDHGVFNLGVLGEHNILNALAAIGIAMDCGIHFNVIRHALENFKHARRRFDLRFQNSEIMIVDDYGHHPTEIRAVLQTAKMIQSKRIQVVFQPHRYSRTQQCWMDFLTCFQECDTLYLLPIYPAGETPISGIDHQRLGLEISKQLPNIKVKVCESLQDAANVLLQNISTGDLILSLGAGSVTQLSNIVENKLVEKK